MSLESPNAALKEWAEKNRSQTQPPVAVPIEETSNSVTPTEEPPKQVAVEAPKEQPKETPAETPTQADQQVSIWDADETAEQKVEAPKFSFSKIGSALELDKVESEDDIVTKVSELKSKLKQLEQAPLSGISDDFKEAIEVAKNGVDWKSYLAEQLVDYTKLTSEQLIQLYEDEFDKTAVRNPKYFTDGKFDQAKADADLEAVPYIVREQLGAQVANSYTQIQRQRQAQMRQQAEQRRVESDKALSNAARNLQELLPFENYGIKFEPKHSTEIYEGINNSKLTKKHLGVEYDALVRSGADMKAVARTVAAAEYAEKMVKFKAQSSKVEAKKELLDKVQNAQINSPGSAPVPEDPKKKILTPAEKLQHHFSNINRNGL